MQNGESDLRLIPYCISGPPEKRTSVVLAKSVPAKRFGITTGEPISAALRKCPDLVIAPPDFMLYKRCSKAFKDICRSYAPVVEEFSIDECFLDMTGTGLVYPDPIHTAYEIKNKIRDELGFTVNIGIGNNKLLAKTAGDFEKPDKVHTLFDNEIAQKFWALPVGNLLFAGKSTVAKLHQKSIYTIGELAAYPLDCLKYVFGEKTAAQLHAHANGIDNSPVKAEPDKAKGYSISTTLEDDVTTFETADAILLSLADSVTAHMRREGAKAFGISVHIRMSSFKNKSHQTKLDTPTDITNVVYTTARRLLREVWHNEPLRLIGIALTDVTFEDYEQMTLLDEETTSHEREEKLDKAIDALRSRFGSDVVKRGTVVNSGLDVGKKFKNKKP